VAKELSLFEQPSDQLPAHLQGYSSGLTEELASSSFESLNRIGTKGCRFRQVVRGIEEGVWDENFLDVIFVKVQPKVSRRFYEGAYQKGADAKNAPPTCYSVDGVKPAEDVVHKQHANCDQCPQNVKGSKISEDGAKAKACSYFRRIAVIRAQDESGTIYRLDVTGGGIWGPSHEKQQQYNLDDYSKALKSRHMDAGAIVTRLSFDTDSSVPKLLFRPMRHISEQDVEVINGLDQEMLEQYREVSMKTVDISGETSVEDEAPPAAAAPKAQAPKPKAAPKPALVVEEEEEVEEEAPPVVQKAAPKPVAKPAPQKAAPVAAPKPVAAAAPKAAPKAAPVVHEVGNDSELDDLLAGLDL